MNGWSALDRFLRTDPGDVGCAEAMEMLHVYVDLVAAGEPAEQRYPGIAAHLRACGPCGEDFEALLAAAALDFRSGTIEHGTTMVQSAHAAALEIGDRELEWRALRMACARGSAGHRVLNGGAGHDKRRTCAKGEHDERA